MVLFEGEKRKKEVKQVVCKGSSPPALAQLCVQTPSHDGGCRAVVQLSRELQHRLHFQVPGKCLATHRDLMVPSLSPDRLQTSTELNFLRPRTDLGIAFSRDHGSKESPGHKPAHSSKE